MHYIRFLKTPRLSTTTASKSKSSSHTPTEAITALITITSDLGESTLYRDCPLTCHLHQGALHTSKKILWKSGARSLPISIEISKFSRKQPVVLEVTADGSTADQLLTREVRETVMSAWSPAIALSAGTKVEDFVERRLDIGAVAPLRIWEEVRESIARHIWDGGLALSMYISQTLAGSGSGALPGFDAHLTAVGRLKVLELGSGCGIVGLTLATLRERCEVTLTDLLLAEEITRRNITASTVAKTSAVEFKVVDWDDEVPGDVLRPRGGYDLLVVADCTYNVDAAPALVKVLTAFMKSSPKALLVLAHKKRHDAEQSFFEMMTSFAVVDKASVVIGTGDEVEEAGEVDLYTFKWKADNAAVQDDCS